jgi:hypothetical protein
MYSTGITRVQLVNEELIKEPTQQQQQEQQQLHPKSEVYNLDEVE